MSAKEWLLEWWVELAFAVTLTAILLWILLHSPFDPFMLANITVSR